MNPSMYAVKSPKKDTGVCSTALKVPGTTTFRPTASLSTRSNSPAGSSQVPTTASTARKKRIA